jgi:N utilization substance protein A
MVEIGERSYGPLSEDLVRRQVDVDIVSGVVEVYYDRDLRARFDQETGDRLPLDDADEADYTSLSSASGSEA